MQRRLRPVLTPAEEKRRTQGLLKQEKMLDEELTVASAIIRLIEDENSAVDNIGRMTNGELRASFIDEADQAVNILAVGRVITKLRLQRDSGGRLQGWQVREALPALEALMDKLRDALLRCREDLGR